MASKDKVLTRRTKEHKLRKHRDLLLESVRIHILPVFIQRGFSITPQAHSGPFDRKSVNTFPFGLLRRARPDGGLDLVEIQFMTHQRAAFRINACAVPREGMMTLGGHRAAGELQAGGLHDHFEMYASSRWRVWFSLLFWRLRTPIQSDYDRLALRVAGLLPEIEVALSAGKSGPHIRRITMLGRALPQGAASS